MIRATLGGLEAWNSVSYCPADQCATVTACFSRVIMAGRSVEVPGRIERFKLSGFQSLT